jgi:hypothetical protein
MKFYDGLDRAQAHDLRLVDLAFKTCPLDWAIAKHFLLLRLKPHLARKLGYGGVTSQNFRHISEPDPNA